MAGATGLQRAGLGRSGRRTRSTRRAGTWRPRTSTRVGSSRATGPHSQLVRCTPCPPTRLTQTRRVGASDAVSDGGCRSDRSAASSRSASRALPRPPARRRRGAAHAATGLRSCNRTQCNVQRTPVKDNMPARRCARDRRTTGRAAAERRPERGWSDGPEQLGELANVGDRVDHGLPRLAVAVHQQVRVELADLRPSRDCERRSRT